MPAKIGYLIFNYNKIRDDIVEAPQEWKRMREKHSMLKKIMFAMCPLIPILFDKTFWQASIQCI